mmetsp:Transcript_28076/g.32069  ORF Transcript_28076/g.32069 Transcript_28076/m.32069 type:complete len:111 (+) Transcript_28076:58-390(+)
MKVNHISSFAMALSSFIQRQFFEIHFLWTDVNDLREVPDHQEVYFRASPSRPNYVVQILVRTPIPVSDKDAPTYFFKNVAEANELQKMRLISRHSVLLLSGLILLTFPMG